MPTPSWVCCLKKRKASDDDVVLANSSKASCVFSLVFLSFLPLSIYLNLWPSSVSVHIGMSLIAISGASLTGPNLMTWLSGINKKEPTDHHYDIFCYVMCGLAFLGMLLSLLLRKLPPKQDTYGYGNSRGVYGSDYSDADGEDEEDDEDDDNLDPNSAFSYIAAIAEGKSEKKSKEEERRENDSLLIINE